MKKLLLVLSILCTLPATAGENKPKCHAVTKAGNACSRSIGKDQTLYCTQHAKMVAEGKDVSGKPAKTAKK